MRTSKTFPGRLLRGIAPYLYGRSARGTAVVVSLLFPAAIAASCWHDGAWRLSGAGKGFAQYYGFWAIFLTTPTLILLTSHLFEKFIESIKVPESYCRGLTRESRSKVDRLVERHISSLFLQKQSAWILAFIIFVLLAWWLFNAVSTISPTPIHTLQHDVFDSSAHHFTYYTTRAYLLFIVFFVCSPAVFVALHVTASLVSILKLLCDDGMLQINLFHADNCGGTSVFGDVNLLVMGVYTNFFAIIYLMYVTHGHAYLAMSLSLASCSVLAVAQSVVAVYYIHKAIAQKKTEGLEAVTRQLEAQFSSVRKDGAFPSNLLALRTHLLGVHTFPYASGALVGVNIIRFAPVVLALLGYFQH